MIFWKSGDFDAGPFLRTMLEGKLADLLLVRGYTGRSRIYRATDALHFEMGARLGNPSFCFERATGKIR
jgi:hypothetical protein